MLNNTTNLSTTLGNLPNQQEEHDHFLFIFLTSSAFFIALFVGALAFYHLYKIKKDRKIQERRQEAGLRRKSKMHSDEFIRFFSKRDNAEPSAQMNLLMQQEEIINMNMKRETSEVISITPPSSASISPIPGKLTTQQPRNLESYDVKSGVSTNTDCSFQDSMSPSPSGTCSDSLYIGNVGKTGSIDSEFPESATSQQQHISFNNKKRLIFCENPSYQKDSINSSSYKKSATSQRPRNQRFYDINFIFSDNTKSGVSPNTNCSFKDSINSSPSGTWSDSQNVENIKSLGIKNATNKLYEEFPSLQSNTSIQGNIISQLEDETNPLMTYQYPNSTDSQIPSSMYHSDTDSQISSFMHHSDTDSQISSFSYYSDSKAHWEMFAECKNCYTKSGILIDSFYSYDKNFSYRVTEIYDCTYCHQNFRDVIIADNSPCGKCNDGSYKFDISYSDSTETTPGFTSIEVHDCNKCGYNHTDIILNKALSHKLRSVAEENSESLGDISSSLDNEAPYAPGNSLVGNLSSPTPSKASTEKNPKSLHGISSSPDNEAPYASSNSLTGKLLSPTSSEAPLATLGVPHNSPATLSSPSSQTSSKASSPTLGVQYNSPATLSSPSSLTSSKASSPTLGVQYNSPATLSSPSSQTHFSASQKGSSPRSDLIICNANNVFVNQNSSVSVEEMPKGAAKALKGAARALQFY